MSKQRRAAGHRHNRGRRFDKQTAQEPGATGASGGAAGHSGDDAGLRRRPVPTGRGGWVAWLITVGALLLVWIMLWGSISVPLVLVGLVSAAVILWLFPLPPMEFEFGLHPWRAIVLLARFVWDVILASLHVAWLAVRPRPPRSTVMEVQLNTDSDLLQHLTALAVSLVPGSLIVNADSERRTLLIHLLDNDYDSVEGMTQNVVAQEERIRAALGSGTQDTRLPGSADTVADPAGTDAAGKADSS